MVAEEGLRTRKRATIVQKGHFTPQSLHSSLFPHTSETPTPSIADTAITSAAVVGRNRGPSEVDLYALRTPVISESTSKEAIL